MEIIEDAKALHGLSVPEVDVNHLRLALDFLLVSHLTGSHYFLVGVHCHRDYVFWVQVEEFLSISGLVKDDAKGGSCVYDFIGRPVLQVAAGVEAAEAVGVLELQVSVGFLAHLGSHLEAVGGAGHDFSLEGVDGQFLVAFTDVFLLEEFVFAGGHVFLDLGDVDHGLAGLGALHCAFLV